jgi:hypothetical protein
MLFQRDSFALVSYKIYTSVNAYTQPERSFTFMTQIAIQQIYPDNEKTALIGVSGNDSNFAFLGVRYSNNQLRIKVYDPLSGVLIELPQNPQYMFNTNYLLQKFVFNNSNGWFYSAHVANTTTIVFAGTPSYVDSNDTHYISRNFTGRFSELQMPPNGKNVYFAPFMSNGFSTMFMYPLDYTNPNSPFNTLPVGDGIRVTLDTAPVSSFPYYTQMMAVLNIKTEEIIFLNKDYDSRKYFKLRAFVSAGSLVASNTRIVPSAQNFTDDSGNFIEIERIIPGAMGSKWAMSDSFPYILGNRNDALDSPISFGLAWQVFFPTMKIEMRKLTSGSSPMVDLTNLDYPEWPHTSMFAYNDYRKLVYDISSNGGQWGLERNSNFIVSDVSFNGFYFNSYTMNIPLQNNYSNTDSND